jgi:alkylation response protein AidB-like acyl-CoA dehydrogenase
MPAGNGTFAGKMAAFAAQRLAPRADLAAETWPQDLWRAMGEAGLLGIGVPERFGGAGGDCRDLARAGEALVRHGGNLGLAAAWLGHCLTARFFLQNFASNAQQAEWLPRIGQGMATLSIAISEPNAGAHPKLLRSSAARVAAGWRLDGEKAYVTNGPIAAAFLVLAVSAIESGRKRFSLFLVPRETPGLSLLQGPEIDFLRPAPHCRLKLENCVVPETALVGPEGGAFEAMALPFRDVEDAVFSGNTLGAIRHLIDRTAAAAARSDGAARETAAAELGAIAALAAMLDSVLDTIAAGAAAEPDSAAEQPARIIGFRLLAQIAAERLGALRARLGITPSAAEAALLRDLAKSQDIAKGPRLQRQTRLGFSAMAQSSTT